MAWYRGFMAQGRGDTARGRLIGMRRLTGIMTTRVGRAIGVMILALIVQSCTTATEESGSAERERSKPSAKAEQVSEAAWLDPRLDGVFVVPGVDFSVYDSLLVPPLDLAQWSPVGEQLPLQELNRNDEQFFRQTYTETLVHILVMSGGYELAMEPGPGVLEVRGRLQQGLQSAKEEGLPRGAVVMLLTLDLHDAQSGELVGTLSRRQPLARSLNERASRLTAMQIQEAFMDWMEWFRTELEALGSSS